MDPIANMLTMIRNGLMVGKPEVVFAYSVFKEEIAKILAKHGFIDAVTVDEEKDGKKMLRVTLRYTNGVPAIRNVRRISKPGLRVYTKATQIPRPRGGFGIIILSTPHGLLTDKEARARHTGGEVVCEVLS